MPLWPMLLLLAFQEPPAFQTEVALVHVDAEVLQNDRIVEGLSREDFRILDGGAPQEIVSFGREEVPLDLILVLDVSPSMAKALRAVADGADAALRQLRPGDRVAVMAFDHPVLLDFTEDFTQVGAVIREKALRLGSMSRLQKNASDAALHFLKQPRTARRRCIVMITDNRGSTRSKRALTDLWEADATLSGLVVIEPVGTGMFTVFQPQSLFMGGIGKLVERTGGDIVNLGVRFRDADEGLRQLIERLRLRYSLHFAMPAAKAGQERKVRVELSADAARRYPNAKIRARQGYIVPSR